MTVDIDPVIVHLGPLMISWYGLFVGLAVVVGTWLAFREGRRKGLPSTTLDQLLVWVLVGGIVGARALHVIDRWDLYAAQPLAVLAIWNGGLAIMGAVLGGTLAGVLVAWRRGLPVRKIADAVAPGAILGQAVGRFACLFTGDAVGRATTGFGITYLDPGAMVPQLGVAYEPVFLYEMAWDLAVFALLWRLRSRLRVDGQLFGLYLGLYALGKFALTFLRTETVWFVGLQEAQLLAIVAVVTAGLWLARTRATRWGNGNRSPQPHS